MAARLHELENRYKKILLVCSVLQWPWIRDQYHNPSGDIPEHDAVEEPVAYDVDPRSLNFLFGELPYLTGLYERARAELEDDEYLSIDGVKQLLIASRGAYRADLGPTCTQDYADALGSMPQVHSQFVSHRTTHDTGFVFHRRRGKNRS